MEAGTVTPVGLIYPANMRGKPMPYKELRQQRTCLKCGKMQDEKTNERGING